ncbi:HutD family protein [Silvimonas sp.]|uniref:HutD/Ves family protein n=1 Tax=Silvimonas sp. TaxID=2650811 RepID=UPI0028431671|nr:HutD family protein [Silvimonas sp.]MDR3426882.1 HutD family protein [Silvimonas sp.]
MANVTLIRAATLTATPWKNGGGVTREITCDPPGAGLDDFIWRISVADVNQAGPFSRFAGVDRTLVLLAGDGMVLQEENSLQHALLQPLDHHQFAGETAITATLPGGATQDFNLMVRRDLARAALNIWHNAHEHRFATETAVLFCASGSLLVHLSQHAPLILRANDAIRIDAASGLGCYITGSGALLAVELEMFTPALLRKTHD